MMPLLVSLLIQGVGGLFLVLVCCTLYAYRGRLYFLYWTVAWFCLSLGLLLNGWQLEWEQLHPETAWLRPWMQDAASLCLTWHGVFWILGVVRFRQGLEPLAQRPVSYLTRNQVVPGLRWSDGILFGAAVAALLLSRLLPAHALPTLLAAGLTAVYTWSLVVFLGVGRSRLSLGAWVLAGFLGLYALEQVHHLAVHAWMLAVARAAYPEYFRYVHYVDFLLQTFTAIGMILVLLDEDQQALRSTLAQLAESESRFRLVFEHGGVGMALLTAQGRCVEVNPALERMLGYSTQELRGRRLADFTHPNETTILPCFHSAPGDGHALDERERCYLHKDGHMVWGHLLRVHVRNPAGEVCHMVSVLVDITARRQAEETLRAERDFSTQVLQTADALILVVGPSGAIVRFNGKCAAVSGYSEAEARGRLLWDFLLPPNFVEPVQDTFQRLLAAPTAGTLECTWLTRLGEERLIAWRFTSVCGDQGRVCYVIGAGLDITDQRRLEGQLRHAQKMETLGTLVGGIAHDFNNQLTAILGNVGLVLMELRQLVTSASPLLPLLTPLADAENAAQRCADMIRRLLAFSRTQIGETQPLILQDVLLEVTRLLKRVLSATISVHVETGPEPWFVKADSTQLHQALMNLAVNARDAMPTGGKLTLRTENRMLTTADCARNVEARPGKFVVLSVTDTGCGMSPEVRARIFEPFFTTKEAGKGTGLGLAMVFGTIKAHRGWILVDSEPNRGTTFQLFIPALTSDCRPRESVSEPVSTGLPLERTRSGTILVVDDEVLIRNYASCLLERVGYRVITAADGEDAIRKFTQQAVPIDLILLDLTMPRMTGPQVLEKLRSLNPRVKVVLSSGSGFSKKERDPLLKLGASAFVAKPYQPQELLRAVRCQLEPPSTTILSTARTVETGGSVPAPSPVR